ncbi:MAG: transposase [Bdellovibrionota bacterium]
MNLRTIVSYYESTAIRLGYLKQAFKAVLRSEGISSQSSWMTSRNEKKWHEIKNPARQLVAQRIFEEMFELEIRKKKYYQEFKENKFNLPVIKNLCSIPGVGPARAHAIAAYISTGHRFENKHKLWSYAKLIRHHDESDGYILRTRTPHGRSELKCAFMGAAQKVIVSPAQTGLKAYYTYLLETKGLDKREANKALARKIAAISLVIMKKGTKYNDSIVRDSFKE